MNNTKYHIGFFGTSEYSGITLEALVEAGHIIDFVVTPPDRPRGRGMVLTPPAVKEWAIANKIPFYQPEKLAHNEELKEALKNHPSDIYIVIDYGKIIPESILNIPPHGSLNIHGSLLPKFRGPSPIESAILADERHTGATIMLMDKEMDHGPILGQKEVVMNQWPPTAHDLCTAIVEAGSILLVQILPEWMGGKIAPQSQNHNEATFTKMIRKEDGELRESDSDYQKFLKYQAFQGWPETYFFAEKDGKKVRLKVKKASFKDGKFAIETVIPEGKKEMPYSAIISKLLS